MSGWWSKAAPRRNAQCPGGLAAWYSGPLTGDEDSSRHDQMSTVRVGDRLPKRGGRLTRGFGAAILRLFGWRLTGEIPDVPRLLAIGAPHTTAWDFIVGIFTIFALGVRVSWLGADWVLRFPLMRWLGGISVDRSRSQGLVGSCIEEFKTQEQLILGLSPEGSRKKVVPWKAGFYHIANGAQVPILLVAIDRQNKLMRFGPSLFPSGDFEADMAKIRPVFAEFLEQYPDQFGM